MNSRYFTSYMAAYCLLIFVIGFALTKMNIGGYTHFGILVGIGISFLLGRSQGAIETQEPLSEYINEQESIITNTKCQIKLLEQKVKLLEDRCSDYERS